MNINPLSLYIKCSRLVFHVEPTENWDESCDEFERDLRQLFDSCLCLVCGELLIEPVNPKKNHYSCDHRVCLDCIGKKRSTPINCKMCSDYTLFEKSQQTKLVLKCFQELCELVHSSWIYDYIQRRTNHDTGQSSKPGLLDIIDAGMNYGQVSIVLDETSSDENSNSSDASKEPLQPLTYSSQIFPNMSPLSPVKTPVGIVQSSPEQFTIISEPVIPLVTAAMTAATLPIVSASSVLSGPQQIVQYVQPQIPSTSKLTPNVQPAPIASFIKYPTPSPMRLTTIASVTSPGSKPIMTPMKVQSSFSSPTQTQIYSVMYTGSGNKITLKRKHPDESASMSPVNNNVSLIFLMLVPVIHICAPFFFR